MVGPARAGAPGQDVFRGGLVIGKESAENQGHPVQGVQGREQRETTVPVVRNIFPVPSLFSWMPFISSVACGKS